MPFLRRRGVVPAASESDMRRHTLHPENLIAIASSKAPLTRSGSHLDLHMTSSSSTALSPDPPSSNVNGNGSSNGTTPSIPAPPVTPPNDSPDSSSSHAAMSRHASIDRPDSPPIQEETPKHRRFSMLRFRNASDSQLAIRAKKQAEDAPPMPRPPEIITTAPTLEFNAAPQRKPRMKLSARLRRSGEEPRPSQDELGVAKDQAQAKKDKRRTMIPRAASTSSKQSITIEEPKRPGTSKQASANGEDGGSALALPTNRMSESSRSDGSSGDRAYSSTTNTGSATSNFFRLPRRRQKQPQPLFPISHLQKGAPLGGGDAGASNSSLVSGTPDSVRMSTSSAASRPGIGPVQTPTQSRPSSGTNVATPPARSPAKTIFQKANPSPATALFRPGSTNSGQSSPTRSHLHLRGRSSTLSSLGRESMDERLAPPTTRTSSSTGRKSFGDLLSLSRLRNNSEPVNGRQGSLTPATPGSSTSKNNSFQLPRESIHLPERREDENPARYLDRLEEVVSRSVIASALSKNTDPFSLAVLRSYMRRFSFFGDPMDMSIRKLLMEAELPKETQQIDRFLQAFANRYHECNPGIYSTPDQAYFIAFSLLILHTDVFNKNNKHKMQKPDYIKNTRGEGIFDEILEVFYDNITYTPFIHVEDDLDINGERIVSHKAKKKGIFPTNTTPEATLKKATKEPIDPYTLIIDHKLDILRPNLKEVMHLEDHYSYLGTAKTLDLKELQKTFFRTGILQIVSARSRPDAFMSEKTATNPQEAQPGVVDIKITKVGLLWRKDLKKKKTRSPWQEWGAILTGAQLYFFRNVAWVKNLMHQYDSHLKQGHDGIPIIFKPPLDQFKPDALISTDGAVALMDSTYKKHKNAFVYVRHGGFEEILIADNEVEMNDWLAKLNYAAAFRTSGVRMRGVVGGNYDGQSRRALRRLDSESVLTASGEVTIARSRIDHKMAEDILAARREIMFQKVSDANNTLEHEEKKLELQLRNARHLQILAPVQPKTRDQMLMSAARLAAQLKWTRVEIWKLKCHRDILLMDLEEERLLMGLPAEGSVESLSADKTSLARERSKASSGTAMPKSPKSPAALSLQKTPVVGEQPDVDSPMTDVFTTPPTSATAPSFHRHQNSWDLPTKNLDAEALRKGSVSSAVSSNLSITATPPRKIGSSSSAKTPVEDHLEPDAGERGLLEQAGLVVVDPSRSPESKKQAAAIDSGESAHEGREGIPPSSSTGGQDRSKIRRSLQRTLREGAGHLSHARSRKGKDSTPGAATDDAASDADTLTRGSGSFLVHGKKASVINFGPDLPSMSPDERIRARKSAQQAVIIESGSSTAPDFRTILQSHAGPSDRRESAASASTATARSFRELHRKYSTAQAAKAASSGGNLTIPSDEDSDAAVSFSDGRRTPLPPIEAEGVEEEDEEDEEEEDEDDGAEDEDEGDYASAPTSARQAQFFTPEPPASPEPEGSNDEEHSKSVEGKERIPSPPLQAVTA